MIIDLNYNDTDFEDKIINLPKNIKTVNVYGDNINITNLCNILENVKSNVEIRSNYQKEIDDEFLKRNTYQGFHRSILNMVKKICSENITKNDFVVDMTVGNGNDTLFLSNISKKVFGFDIQGVAIENTKTLLKENNAPQEVLDILVSPQSAAQGIGAAVENILLAATEMGYGTCYMTGPTHAKKEIEELIGFEKEGYELMSMISLGVAEDDTPKQPPRKPLEEVVTFID